MKDERIIDLFFQRSEEAVRHLADKYGPACHSLSYRILGDWQDAEECVSDAYLGIWNAIPPHRPDHLAAFLLKIVRNHALKRYQANTAAKRDSRYDLPLEELQTVIPAPDTVEGELAAKELAGYFDEFLAALPARDRALFLGRYWFADTIKEAGDRVGISEKNASVRLTRLRKKLRDYLTERGYQP